MFLTYIYIKKGMISIKDFINRTSIWKYEIKNIFETKDKIRNSQRRMKLVASEKEKETSRYAIKEVNK